MHNFDYTQFETQRKRGGDDQIEFITNKLLNTIEIKYLHFEKDNDRKRSFVEVSLKS